MLPTNRSVTSWSASTSNTVGGGVGASGRRAQNVAQLSHPNIVSVCEVGRDGDTLYIVSELVWGPTLADWLTGQQLTTREAAQLCMKSAGASEHAHGRGLNHRDLKPGNITLRHPHAIKLQGRQLLMILSHDLRFVHLRSVFSRTMLGAHSRRALSPTTERF
ncbi:Serine/threonine-protein kinase PrkC [Pirellulimonas nuda]|uniref:Serine/threonine-protein kinase PrkC n=1 Tax=Pirellulimonas nuda TaxID=2528009 RepID=A0A518DE55_9BACT|nr:protein kinase [Pirellulimonas nuda]QDU89743.1 Serine/threonine-protein kinase PrkC [Pirellulimonas nuda]